jgi:murein DD-endopeptidase MepM/ murein hydrolase activator NlpD
VRRVLLSLSIVAVVFVQPAHAAEWQRPVLGRVVDPFDEHTRYGPGHRGIDFATRPGAFVRAAGAGTVTFAGRVAGELHVTVGHANGLRTSYSQLRATRVRRGQRVRAGQVVGVAAGNRVHLGLRRGRTYLDPATLFDAGPPIVRLIPVETRRIAR